MIHCQRCLSLGCSALSGALCSTFLLGPSTLVKINTISKKQPELVQNRTLWPAATILDINECLVTRTSLVTTKQLKFQKGIWTYIYETSRRGNKALVKVIGNKVLCIIPVLWMVLNGPRMHAQTCTCLHNHRECVRPMLTLTLTQTDVTSTSMQKETSETRRNANRLCLSHLS